MPAPVVVYATGAYSMMMKPLPVVAWVPAASDVAMTCVSTVGVIVAAAVNTAVAEMMPNASSEADEIILASDPTMPTFKVLVVPQLNTWLTTT